MDWPNVYLVLINYSPNRSRAVAVIAHDAETALFEVKERFNVKPDQCQVKDQCGVERTGLMASFAIGD